MISKGIYFIILILERERSIKIIIGLVLLSCKMKLSKTTENVLQTTKLLKDMEGDGLPGHALDIELGNELPKRNILSL